MQLLIQLLLIGAVFRVPAHEHDILGNLIIHGPAELFLNERNLALLPVGSNELLNICHGGLNVHLILLFLEILLVGFLLCFGDAIFSFEFAVVNTIDTATGSLLIIQLIIDFKTKTLVNVLVGDEVSWVD
jgi:hypothetical protein